MVGYGTTGTAYPFHWTDNGSGKGTRRWGSQEIDEMATRIYQVGSTFTENIGFWMDFHRDNTTYEAGAGVGDSGGGIFYKDGESWKLAGINAERSVVSGNEYVSTFSISMPDYADWITKTIPEPVSTSLMGFGVIGLFLSRAKRQRKLVGGSMFPIRREPLCDTFLVKEERVLWEKALYGYMIGLQQVTKIYTLHVWKKVYGWGKEMDIMFWNHMADTYERKMIRRKAIKSDLKKKVIDSFDAFLALVMK